MSASQDNLPAQGHLPQTDADNLGKVTSWARLIERQYLNHTCDECPSVSAVVVTVMVMGFGIREASVHIPGLPLPSQTVLQTLLRILNPTVLAVKWI